MSRPFAAALALLGAVVVSGCASHRPPKVPPGIDPAHLHFADPVAEEGDPAPDFTLPLADGSGTLTLSALRGKPVLLAFGSYT